MSDFRTDVVAKLLTTEQLNTYDFIIASFPEKLRTLITDDGGIITRAENTDVLAVLALLAFVIGESRELINNLIISKSLSELYEYVNNAVVNPGAYPFGEGNKKLLLLAVEDMQKTAFDPGLTVEQKIELIMTNQFAYLNSYKLIRARGSEQALRNVIIAFLTTVSGLINKTYTTSLDMIYITPGEIIHDDAIPRENGNPFTAVSGWSNTNATLSIVDGLLRVTNSSLTELISSVFASTEYALSGTFYVNTMVKVASNQANYIKVYKKSSGDEQIAKIVNAPEAGKWHLLSGIFTTSGEDWELVIEQKYPESPLGKIMDIKYVYCYNIGSLITNKLYSPMYNMSFDRLTTAQLTSQLDMWFAYKAAFLGTDKNIIKINLPYVDGYVNPLSPTNPEEVNENNEVLYNITKDNSLYKQLMAIRPAGITYQIRMPYSGTLITNELDKVLEDYVYYIQEENRILLDNSEAILASDLITFEEMGEPGEYHTETYASHRRTITVALKNNSLINGVAVLIGDFDAEPDKDSPRGYFKAAYFIPPGESKKVSFSQGVAVDPLIGTEVDIYAGCRSGFFFGAELGWFSSGDAFLAVKHLSIITTTGI